MDLTSFGPGINAAVIGDSGGIGSALANELESCQSIANVFRMSRSGRSGIHLDLTDETSMMEAATLIAGQVDHLDLVILATGILHNGDRLQPEISWRTLDRGALDMAFAINASGPALVAKHFLPLLSRDRKSAFAALSARVGSIEDNQIGGWFAYRASKAALNMILKTLSIELARRNPAALCVGLHPGTVATSLSEPFQANVPNGRLFTPGQSARYLLNVLDDLTVAQTGKVFAWDGSEVPS